MTNSTTLQLRTRKKNQTFHDSIYYYLSIILPLLELRFNLSFICHVSKKRKKKYLQTIKRKDEEMMERHDLLERISHSTNNDRRINGS